MSSIWETKKIRKIRRDLDIPVKTAAEVFDITPEYLYMIEAGMKQPSQKLIVKIAAYYKKPLTFFLKFDEIEENTENLSYT